MEVHVAVMVWAEEVRVFSNSSDKPNFIVQSQKICGVPGEKLEQLYLSFLEGYLPQFHRNGCSTSQIFSKQTILSTSKTLCSAGRHFLKYYHSLIECKFPFLKEHCLVSPSVVCLPYYYIACFWLNMTKLPK